MVGFSIFCTFIFLVLVLAYWGLKQKKLGDEGLDKPIPYVSPAKPQFYNFQEAREQIERLRMMKLDLQRFCEKVGTWDWWIEQEITWLELEIQAAHENVNIKMTPVVSRDHSVKRLDNLITPSIPEWRWSDKEGPIDVSKAAEANQR